MIVNLCELEFNRPKHVHIHGNEEWLDVLYSYFPAPKRAERSCLKGEMLIQRHESFVQITGQYTYEPYLKCFRCNLLFPKAIDESIDMNFLLESKETAKEVDLEPGDLEEFYLEQGKVDLEAVINESVHLALPLNIKCQKCTESNNNGPLYSARNKSQASCNGPFSILETLKLSE